MIGHEEQANERTCYVLAGVWYILLAMYVYLMWHPWVALGVCVFGLSLAFFRARTGVIMALALQVIMWCYDIHFVRALVAAGIFKSKFVAFLALLPVVSLVEFVVSMLNLPLLLLFPFLLDPQTPKGMHIKYGFLCFLFLGVMCALVYRAWQVIHAINVLSS